MELEVKRIRHPLDKRILIKYQVSIWLDAKEYKKLIRECGNVPITSKMMLAKIGGRIFNAHNTMYCINCGKPIPKWMIMTAKDMKKCPMCGKKLIRYIWK